MISRIALIPILIPKNTNRINIIFTLKGIEKLKRGPSREHASEQKYIQPAKISI